VHLLTESSTMSLKTLPHFHQNLLLECIIQSIAINHKQTSYDSKLMSEIFELHSDNQISLSQVYLGLISEDYYFTNESMTWSVATCKIRLNAHIQNITLCTFSIILQLQLFEHIHTVRIKNHIHGDTRQYNPNCQWQELAFAKNALCCIYSYEAVLVAISMQVLEEIADKTRNANVVFTWNKINQCKTWRNSIEMFQTLANDPFLLNKSYDFNF